MVPEYHENQTFTLSGQPQVLSQFKAAKDAGIVTRPVVLGPISLLLLGKPSGSTAFKPISLLSKLLPVYCDLFSRLVDAGARCIQVDEPMLSNDAVKHDASMQKLYRSSYRELSSAAPELKIMLTTYFAAPPIWVTELPGITGFHLDLVRAPSVLPDFCQRLLNNSMTVSLGLIDGRNIWRAELVSIAKTVRSLVNKIGAGRVIVSTSCSMLHVPHSLKGETHLPNDVAPWLAFATEKLAELAIVCTAVNHGDAYVAETLAYTSEILQSKRSCAATNVAAIKRELANVTQDMYKREVPIHERKLIQRGMYVGFKVFRSGDHHTKHPHELASIFPYSQQQQSDHSRRLENCAWHANSTKKSDHRVRVQRVHTK